jgi:hypothetical protein
MLKFHAVFGEALAVAPLKTFYIINILLLVLGPFAVAPLLFFASLHNKLYWAPRGWGRVPAAIIVGGGLTIGLGMIYARVNPFVSLFSPYLLCKKTVD